MNVREAVTLVCSQHKIIPSLRLRLCKKKKHALNQIWCNQIADFGCIKGWHQGSVWPTVIFWDGEVTRAGAWRRIAGETPSGRGWGCCQRMRTSCPLRVKNVWGAVCQVIVKAEYESASSPSFVIQLGLREGCGTRCQLSCAEAWIQYHYIQHE